jgi:hypothetical protein
MAGNALLEAVVGMIPVLGDLFDFYWKANSRNRQLLETHINQQLHPAAPRGSAWTPVVLIAVVLLLMFLLFNIQVPGL